MNQLTIIKNNEYVPEDENLSEWEELYKYNKTTIDKWFTEVVGINPKTFEDGIESWFGPTSPMLMECGVSITVKYSHRDPVEFTFTFDPDDNFLASYPEWALASK